MFVEVVETETEKPQSMSAQRIMYEVRGASPFNAVMQIPTAQWNEPEVLEK